MKSKIRAPHQMIKHVFIDVDGVLLDFEVLMTTEMKRRGIPAPTKEMMASRQEDFISSAFPGLVSSEAEWEVVDAVFKSGILRDQPRFDVLDVKKVSQALSKPNMRILTKLPSEYAGQRRNCLLGHFGVDLDGRLHTVYGKTTKGDEILRYCAEHAIDPATCALIDDRHDNLETAMLAGAHGILVERSYNVRHHDRLALTYEDRFSTVPHASLASLLVALSLTGKPGSKKTPKGDQKTKAKEAKESKETKRTTKPKSRSKHTNKAA